MGRLLLLIPLAWRNIWRNPRRTIITILVVGVGLWSILIFAVIMDAWAVSSRDTTLKLLAAEGQIHAAGYLDDPTAVRRMKPPQGAFREILKSDAVIAYAQRVRVAAIVRSEYKTLPVTFVGVIPEQESRVSVLPAEILEGRYLESENDSAIVLGRNLVRRLKARLGKRVVMIVQDADGKLAERAFDIVGIYAGPQQIEDEFVFTGLKPAQTFTAMGGDISEIAFDATDDETLPDLLAALKAAAPDLDIQSWKTLEPLAYALSTFFNEFTMLWLWVMFAMMAIGIVNTQLMAVFERVREFGLLHALGMRPRLVLLEVALESAMLIGLGVAIGVALSIFSVLAFPDGINLGFLGRGAELFGAGRVLYLRIDLRDFIFFSAIVWSLGVVATLWPAWRASNVSPVVAMGRI